jgi:ABC-type Na+ efflux pump permease subunit
LQTGGAGGGGGGAVGIVILVVYLAIIVAFIAGLAKTFQKAGEAWWAAIIPIYNVWVMIKVSDNPWWWLILFLIPLLQIIAVFKISIDIAKQFGQGLWFGLGLVILGFIFYPLLGFGDYKYQGSAEAA